MRHNLNNAFHRKPTDPLFTHFKANLARFSAHKASYVHRVIENELNSPADGSDASPQQKAAARLRMFDQFQRTERNTAIARARTAVQFERFNQPDDLRLFPNLRWLPSRSAEPRPTHMQFYNRVWAKDDPFWNSNCPGTEWNCKCDLEQTNDPPTENANIHTPAPPLGLEGNPYHTHQLFTDRVSYIRHNTRQLGAQTAEYQARSIMRDTQRKNAKNSPLIDKTAYCTIDGKQHPVRINARGIKETVQANYTSPQYWLKNEVLDNFDAFLSKAKYLGNAPVDLSHNTRRTLHFKKHLSKFHYFSSNGLFFHIAENQNGKLFLYSITTNKPSQL